MREVTPVVAAPAVEPTTLRLSMREKLSYGGGEVAANIGWNMAMGFLLYYYTDVALLPVAALGTLMLVTRSLDAAFDVGVGLLVDRTQTRFGKARPYLLFAAIPFSALIVLTFSTPDITPTGKVIYAYITFGLLGLAYSLLYIPYSAMLPIMTRDSAEKIQLGSFRAMGTSAGSIFVYGLTLPIVAWAGGGKTGFLVAALVMAIATALLAFNVFVNCRERINVNIPPSTTAISSSVRRMFRNPAWLIVFIYGLLMFVKLGIMVPTMPYMANDVIKHPWVTGVILPMLSIALLAGGFFADPVFRRIGVRRANIYAIVINVALYALLPLLHHEPKAYIALFAIANVTVGLQAAGIFVMLATSVEVHDIRFEKGKEGLLVSGSSFGLKAGTAIGAAITAYALALAGYQPTHVTPDAVDAIAWLFYLGQILMALIQLICISFYRFDDTNLLLDRAHS